MSRANPFSDLDDFAPHASSKPVAAETINKLSETSGFPSRKARGEKKEGEGEGTSVTPPKRQQRRHTTGRNRQINIKATEQTISKLYDIADDLNLPLGAVLEHALAALVDQRPATGERTAE
ncbi:hypothetical protein TomMM35A_33740 [Sphingobium sp. TomMM35A]